MSDVELSCRPIRLGGTGRDFRRKGFALLVTLTALVIITVLILAFFLGVTNEYVTAKSYSDGVNTKFMTDTAVNIVMGQIDAATQGQQADDTKHRYTWASQPGMIRTYSDGDLDTQVAANCFKLYSSSTMVFAGTSGANILSQAAGDVPPGWNGQPSRYTDLNAPVVDITGTLNFPIIDGNGLMPLTVNGQQVLTYDTNGDGIPDIEGFSVPATSATYDSTQPISASNNPVSMPVQWLYVLKDGTITSPDPATSSTASPTVQWTTTRTDAPTPSNPIVGRIAFWTDDDTSKLNVNTASEGTYYGAPTALNYMDNASNVTGKTFGFASSPPATGEYSRYPGHPAQTCLSVVLGSWVGSKLSPPLNLNVLNAPTAYSAATDDSNYLSGLQQYLQGATGTALLPRYGFGGSEAGTVASANTPTGTPYAAVTSATNRLFVSPDELIFDPTRANFPGLDKTVVKKLGFFLTANSRAPELTPFNTPKVSIWPQWMKLADRNSASGSVLGTSAGHTGGNTDLNNNFKNYFKSDKFYSSVLAFCSEFGTNASSPSGKNEYFFQRFKAGTTSSFGSWFDTYDDWDNVPRNQQLANYLCNMGTLSIPGYGKPFVGDKYTARNFSQIVLETFDYIRSDIDRIGYLTADDTTDNISGSNAAWLWFIPPVVVPSNLPGLTGAGDALKGFGFYPICTQIGFLEELTDTPGVQSVRSVGEFSLPGHSIPGTQAYVGTTFENLSSIFATPPTPDPFYAGFRTDATGGTNTHEGNIMHFFYAPTYTSTASLPLFPVQNSGQTLTMGGGTVTFDFWPFVQSLNDTPPANPPGRTSPYVQILQVNFPATSAPFPTTDMIQRNPTGAGGYVLGSTAASTTVRTCVFNVNYTPYRGDWRLLGATWRVNGQQVDASGNSLFQPSANYSNPSFYQAHSFYLDAFENSQSYNLAATSTTPTGSLTPTTSISGSLLQALANTDYLDTVAPMVNIGLTGNLVVNNLGKPGDWDTGGWDNPDGPYINLADQIPDNTFLLDNKDSSSENFGAAFSPNRFIASPVQFGSLPTGVFPSDWTAAKPTGAPWQTLLFCPNPAARTTTSANTLASALPTTAGTEHVGFQNPPDHLYLEFLTMPVVEPYPISEPFSTAGKVNLNYQIMPFTTIERSTAVRGVLKNMLLTGICGNDVKGSGKHPSPATDTKYKYYPNGTYYSNEIRYNIDRDATLSGWEKYYFDQGAIFRYPSEICDLFLVPKQIPGATYAGTTPPTSYDNMVPWWSSATDLNAMIATGDNLREDPYNNLYPRLTTKSNTYTVHYCVQTLQKRTGAPTAQWTEGSDVVTGEYRGSSTIERYLDPNDPKLTAAWDTATMKLDFTTSGVDLSPLYHFRVLATRKFAP